MKPFHLITTMNRCLVYTKLPLPGSNSLHLQCFQNARGIFSSKMNKLVSSSVPFPVSSRGNVQMLKIDQLARHFSFSEKRLEKSLSAGDMKKAMDQLTEQFTEARELIEDARESLDTVYFSEDMSEAQEAVKSTLDQYQKLLDQLSDDQRQEVLRTIGLRMEELKAQEQALKETLQDSH